MSQPPAGEFGLIAALAELFGQAPPRVALGIGDDCAALDVGGDRYLLWTVDTLLEGVHFDLTCTTLAQLGRKALAVNLSDIAAMGGEAAYALLSLGWPPERDLTAALEFGRGLAECARDYGVAIIGGDTVASPQGLAVTVTVLGWVVKDEMLTRGGAKVGDAVYVTGPLGESAAGLEVLRRGLNVEADLARPLVSAHLDPQPELAAGRVLAREGLATALIDLSDGVAGDLAHICRAGGVGARIYARQVPLTAGVQAVARLIERDPLFLALMGGEDYRLLFTSPPEKSAALFQAFSRAGLAAPVHLGEIVSGSEVTLVTPGHETVISGKGFDHFRLDLHAGKE